MHERDVPKVHRLVFVHGKPRPLCNEPAKKRLTTFLEFVTCPECAKLSALPKSLAN
jgi:hypothetical protein